MQPHLFDAREFAINSQVQTCCTTSSPTHNRNPLEVLPLLLVSMTLSGSHLKPSDGQQHVPEAERFNLPQGSRSSQSTRQSPEPMGWTETNVDDVRNISLDYSYIQRKPGHWKAESGPKAGDFHERRYTSLFTRVYDLALAGFSGDGNLNGERSPWTVHYSEEFYEYVKVVARPDPNTRHWDALLRNEAERVFLVTGIMMRALDAKVLSSLMFGAGSKHKAALITQDIDLVHAEGEHI